SMRRDRAPASALSCAALGSTTGYLLLRTEVDRHESSPTRRGAARCRGNHARADGNAQGERGIWTWRATTATSRRSSARFLIRCVPRCGAARSEEHTSELQSLAYLVCR